MNDFLQNPSWCYLAWVYHGAFSIFFLTWLSKVSWGFPGGSRSKEPASQCRRHKWHGFDPWIRKIPWRRPWQPTPVFLPGESHGQRSLPWPSMRLQSPKRLSMNTQKFHLKRDLVRDRFEIMVHNRYLVQKLRIPIYPVWVLGGSGRARGEIIYPYSWLSSRVEQRSVLT